MKALSVAFPFWEHKKGGINLKNENYRLNFIEYKTLVDYIIVIYKTITKKKK
jgi:hypothetical protein